MKMLLTGLISAGAVLTCAFVSITAGAYDLSNVVTNTRGAKSVLEVQTESMRDCEDRISKIKDTLNQTGKTIVQVDKCEQQSARAFVGAVHFI